MRHHPQPASSLRRVARPLAAAAALWAILLSAPGLAADPRPLEPMDAGGIAHALHRLQTVGSALYVAAHPDDENTALLAWLTHVKGVRTAYLSMTRGDGGQNLIGQELGAPLGVIRTQELLAARRMDGAEQRFTRALDFGFSKNADESLAFWGHDSVLADVVWAIRRFQPDIIVTRFPPDSTAGHGHHTASAILAEEAFAAAADPARFPEQLDTVRPWQAKRLLWNVFSFGPTQVDSSWLVVDVGAYDPLLGRSMSELAGLSRSNHKSQGFGAAERRGSLPQYLSLRAGAPAKRDPFEGVDLSWKRFPGGDAVGALLAESERAFDPRHPEALLPLLARAHAALGKLPPGVLPGLLARRRAELEQVMASCAGLWLEAVSARPSATTGEPVSVATSVLARTPAAVRLESVTVDETEHARVRTLVPNVAANDTLAFTLRDGIAVTQPYWLRVPAGKGLFRVADRDDLGAPDNRPALTASFRLRIAGEPVTYELPVAYRWTDAVQGERWRMFEVSPPATLAFEQPFQLFPDATPRALRVTVTARKNKLAGTLRLEVPSGWSVKPSSEPVAIERESGELSATFTVLPGRDGGTARAVLDVGGHAWSQGAQRIDYPHIPVQTLFPPAELRLVRADVTLTASRVGYLAGSGDQIAEALHQMGATVTPLSDDDVASGDLSRFDAIVTGVRAYNTRPRLRALQPRLLDWVAKGGTLLVQYVTTADGPVDYLGPRPFRVSRDRVTVEEAPVTFLKPAHRLLNVPNKLGPGDFDGWVQERGLYFANPWDPAYDAVLGSHDPGEPSRDGGLLYARQGSGEFVYCGYALFRQVPAGVPGAWRLLANLVSGSRVRFP
ncbi:MAG TPA: PIG-L family deacetylase [Candidatus Eisenbacteria bacterium]|jgi:LmbE family N-acetylglucosaminyl deacetylase